MIAAIRDIDVSLRIDRDTVRGVELPGLVAWFPPRFQPVAIPVDLCDARIDVTVANVGVSIRIPRHVCDLSKHPILGGQRRIGLLQWRSAIIRRFLLSAEHHRHAPFRIELDHHVRAFVRNPDVVLWVDLYGVRVRPCVQVVADLAQKLAIRPELKKLRRTSSIRRPCGIATRKNEEVSL